MAKGLGDELLCSPIAVHFCSIDHRHAEIDRQLQRGNLARPRLPAFPHVPGADPENRDAFSTGQPDCSHPGFCRLH